MLKFNSDDNGYISGGKIAQGYRQNWNLNRFGGSYSQGKNFFCIHWEVYSNTPNIIRFHIESPKFEIDERLNNLKLEITGKIKENMSKIRELSKVGEFKESSRSNDILNIKNDKTTELFQVILEENLDFKTAQKSMERVDKDLGNFINTIIKPYEEKLKQPPFNLKIK